MIGLVSHRILDEDRGVALDTAVEGVPQRTLAGTVDIAHGGTAEHDVASIRVILRFHLVSSNLAATDGDAGVALYNGLLAAAEDAGAHLGVGATHADNDVAIHVATVGLIGSGFLNTHTTAVDAAEGIADNL